MDRSNAASDAFERRFSDTKCHSNTAINGVTLLFSNGTASGTCKTSTKGEDAVPSSIDAEVSEKLTVVSIGFFIQ